MVSLGVNELRFPFLLGNYMILVVVTLFSNIIREQNITGIHVYIVVFYQCQAISQ